MGKFTTLFTAALCVLQAAGLPSPDLRSESETLPETDVIGNEVFNFESPSLLESELKSATNLDSIISKTTETKRAVQCKLFPGDLLWPSELVWSTFNLALGKNALIKTVPLASPCYKGWKYDAAKCATLVSDWKNSHIQ